MSELISTMEPTKSRGRPKQVLAVEQIQSKKDKMKERAKELKREKAKIMKTTETLVIAKPKMKRGKKAKEYTRDEILNKINHTKKY